LIVSIFLLAASASGLEAFYSCSSKSPIIEQSINDQFCTPLISYLYPGHFVVVLHFILTL
jgi:regulator of sigma D